MQQRETERQSEEFRKFRSLYEKEKVENARLRLYPECPKCKKEKSEFGGISSPKRRRQKHPMSMVPARKQLMDSNEGQVSGAPASESIKEIESPVANEKRSKGSLISHERMEGEYEMKLRAMEGEIEQLRIQASLKDDFTQSLKTEIASLKYVTSTLELEIEFLRKESMRNEEYFIPLEDLEGKFKKKLQRKSSENLNSASKLSRNLGYSIQPKSGSSNDQEKDVRQRFGGTFSVTRAENPFTGQDTNAETVSYNQKSRKALKEAGLNPNNNGTEEESHFPQNNFHTFAMAEEPDALKPRNLGMDLGDSILNRNPDGLAGSPSSNNVSYDDYLQTISVGNLTPRKVSNNAQILNNEEYFEERAEEIRQTAQFSDKDIPKIEENIETEDIEKKAMEEQKPKEEENAPSKKPPIPPNKSKLSIGKDSIMSSVLNKPQIPTIEIAKTTSQRHVSFDETINENLEERNRGNSLFQKMSPPSFSVFEPTPKPGKSPKHTKQPTATFPLLETANDLNEPEVYDIGEIPFKEKSIRTPSSQFKQAKPNLAEKKQDRGFDSAFFPKKTDVFDIFKSIRANLDPKPMKPAKSNHEMIVRPSMPPKYNVSDMYDSSYSEANFQTGKIRSFLQNNVPSWTTSLINVQNESKNQATERAEPKERITGKPKIEIEHALQGKDFCSIQQRQETKEILAKNSEVWKQGLILTDRVFCQSTGQKKQPFFIMITLENFYLVSTEFKLKLKISFDDVLEIMIAENSAGELILKSKSHPKLLVESFHRTDILVFITKSRELAKKRPIVFNYYASVTIEERSAEESKKMNAEISKKVKAKSLHPDVMDTMKYARVAGDLFYYKSNFFGIRTWKKYFMVLSDVGILAFNYAKIGRKQENTPNMLIRFNGSTVLKYEKKYQDRDFIFAIHFKDLAAGCILAAPSLKERDLWIEMILRFQFKPVLFIEFDEEEGGQQIKVNHEAISILHSMSDDPIAVIGIVGPQRTGKSFLANQLLKRMDGFAIGPTTNPCTKGIWIWSKPILINRDGQSPINCLLLDTEGLFSLSAVRNTNQDMKLFAMSLLLSSY